MESAWASSKISGGIGSSKISGKCSAKVSGGIESVIVESGDSGIGKSGICESGIDESGICESGIGESGGSGNFSVPDLPAEKT